jgi:hypothetical protein
MFFDREMIQTSATDQPHVDLEWKKKNYANNSQKSFHKRTRMNKKSLTVLILIYGEFLPTTFANPRD